jgi:CRP-like cAMP-binding protein/small-conductance mechanosensitive channel
MLMPPFFSTWWDTQAVTALTFVALWLLLFLMARILGVQEAKRLRFLGVLLLVQVLLGLAATAAYDPTAKGFRALPFLAGLLAVGVGMGLFNSLVLGLLLGRFQRSVPTVLRQVLSVVGTAAGAIVLLAHQGLDVKALLPTGAVLTAVVGLALQQTLGNLIGGLSIQLDKSVRVGDWVQVEGLYGRVSAIRWRSSTLETNDYESIVVPNAQLLAAKLLVRGRRGGEETAWRHWVRFRLAFNAPPAEVIHLALQALRAEPVPGVAAAPAPDCVLVSMEEGTALYALRYWLTDFVNDDATDSAVRLRLFYALRRAGFEPAMPAQQVTVQRPSAEAQEAEAKERHAARERALRGMELFAKLKDDELSGLAGELRELPYAPGEPLCSQGEAADSLYILEQGRVSVRVSSDGAEGEVAQLGPGAFFGEMGLMTGEPRNATVRALGHVQALRLEKPAFQRLLLRRPELAEAIAEVLADRRAKNEQARESLDQATRESRQRQHRGQFLARIRDYFGYRA